MTAFKRALVGWGRRAIGPQVRRALGSGRRRTLIWSTTPWALPLSLFWRRVPRKPPPALKSSGANPGQVFSRDTAPRAAAPAVPSHVTIVHRTAIEKGAGEKSVLSIVSRFERVVRERIERSVQSIAHARHFREVVHHLATRTIERERTISPASIAQPARQQLRRESRLPGPAHTAPARGVAAAPVLAVRSSYTRQSYGAAARIPVSPMPGSPSPAAATHRETIVNHRAILEHRTSRRIRSRETVLIATTRHVETSLHLPADANDLPLVYRTTDRRPQTAGTAAITGQSNASAIEPVTGDRRVASTTSSETFAPTMAQSRRQAPTPMVVDPSLASRLADDVMRRIEQKMRIHRERNGL